MIWYIGGQDRGGRIEGVVGLGRGGSRVGSSGSLPLMGCPMPSLSGDVRW